jgi:hypothetical protein
MFEVDQALNTCLQDDMELGKDVIVTVQEVSA